MMPRNAPPRAPTIRNITYMHVHVLMCTVTPPGVPPQEPQRGPKEMSSAAPWPHPNLAPGAERGGGCQGGRGQGGGCQGPENLPTSFRVGSLKYSMFSEPRTVCPTARQNKTEEMLQENRRPRAIKRAGPNLAAGAPDGPRWVDKERPGLKPEE